jgi:hypothetical protein
MLKAMLLATVVTASLSMVLVDAAGVDFSGDWVLKERIPSGGAKTPQVLLVSNQTGNDFKVITIMIDEDKIIESHYTLDGTVNVNTDLNEAGLVTIRSTSKWDNGALVLEGSITFENQDKDVTNKWKTEYLLSENGTALAVTETHQTPFGETVISQIFSRK